MRLGLGCQRVTQGHPGAEFLGVGQAIGGQRLELDRGGEHRGQLGGLGRVMGQAVVDRGACL
ncbi:MAG: hypothetical protein CVU38_20365 [Chloroflexi bacterium HGW-Chloroflexi-1]|nr:MAG: hypothetical protein CVU38_20365 [Chloroflexi bacterium HGW-Chloroflexi-1]